MSKKKPVHAVLMAGKQLFPKRPAISSRGWEVIRVPGLDDLMRRSWPIRSLDGFHTILPVKECVAGECAKNLRPAGFMPVASCPNGDKVLVEVSEGLSVFAMSHSSFIELSDGPLELGSMGLRALGYDLAAYLERFLRMEQGAAEIGEYDTDDKLSLPTDYWEVDE